MENDMFQPHILALSGTSNTGKTTTIKIVRNKILDHFNELCKETDCLSKRATSDIKRIFKIGEFKIGIESQGDPLGRLCESLKFFDDQECHVIICTSRTSGQTVDDINAYELKYTVIPYKKKNEPENKMESIWNITATEIFNKVISLYDDFNKVK